MAAGALARALAGALLNERVVMRLLDLMGNANKRQLSDIERLLEEKLDPIRAELKLLDRHVWQLDARLSLLERAYWGPNEPEDTGTHPDDMGDP